MYCIIIIIIIQLIRLVPRKPIKDALIWVKAFLFFPFQIM